ncbi:hypothetical protein EMIHUDRAFT_112672 [Emiliania huxleyi CCMP1516]|uniref:Protein DETOXIFICATION n=2 Tax=Emiliania huxleyi TaxID=2903 RepID=A0A0D3K7I3_EMIH1|nr:hypothetical protein EMIHUDRAFT_112672 [Emiliania huxleyi CCMP1516]EOD31718.1 hypothetical protein EMIHUDRAFT_112672 [Emiliania huxleyi CCMP1516]|eukprot:XP_005784147.1 hypothetical protein EMIHUDRAFT_112672 [Emiliania huxleyi CCMP1516]
MLLLSLAAVSFARFARHPPALSPRRLGTPALSDGGDEAAIDRQMAEIGAPALVGLSIEPVASLVDTAFVGRCCATADLAGVGIGVGIFNLVAKAFNFLSPATTSLVAAASPESEPGEFTTPMLQAVSASLAVASVAGLGIAAALTLGAGRLLNTLGIAAGSPMRPSAVAYLLLRGLSAPASLGLCCIQGAFRGARDTRTPLLGLATVTAVNVALDAAFIPARALGWGAAGAAGATAAAQYAGAAVMLRQLLRRCGESSLQLPRRRDVVRLLSSGSVLTLRTLAVLGTISYSSLLAARVGAASGAAHQVCLQLWLAASLLADAVAIAAQALLANVAAARRTSAARTVVQRTLRAGCATGLGTAAALSIGGRSLFRLFAADPAVLAAAAAAWPAVVAYSGRRWPRLLFGASDYGFCAVGMLLSAAPAAAAMRWLAPRWGLPGVWAGLGVLMGMRTLLAAARIASRTGPWRGLLGDPRAERRASVARRMAGEAAAAAEAAEEAVRAAMAEAAAAAAAAEDASAAEQRAAFDADAAAAAAASTAWQFAASAAAMEEATAAAEAVPPLSPEEEEEWKRAQMETRP